jgi:SlyX protein
LEKRLTDLEIKLSFAEDMIDELNRTIFRQQQQIDFLVQEVLGLRQQVQTIAAPRSTSLRDEIPPHY